MADPNDTDAADDDTQHPADNAVIDQQAALAEAVEQGDGEGSAAAGA